MEDIILDFWRCSLRSDFSEFDWDGAFKQYCYHLGEHLNGHGLLSFDEFLKYHDNMFGLNSMESDVMDCGWAVCCTNYVHFSGVDVVEAILKGKYEAFQNAFGDLKSDLVELYEKATNIRGMSEPELIQLFDECIHAQHETGEILQDVDVEHLREQAENEWKEEQEELEEEKSKFVTNMRDFL